MLNSCIEFSLEYGDCLFEKTWICVNVIFHFYLQVEKEKWFTGRDQYKWAMQELMSEIEGVSLSESNIQ